MNEKPRCSNPGPPSQRHQRNPLAPQEAGSHREPQESVGQVTSGKTNHSTLKIFLKFDGSSLSLKETKDPTPLPYEFIETDRTLDLIRSWIGPSAAFWLPGGTNPHRLTMTKALDLSLEALNCVHCGRLVDPEKYDGTDVLCPNCA